MDALANWAVSSLASPLDKTRALHGPSRLAPAQQNTEKNATPKLETHHLTGTTKIILLSSGCRQGSGLCRLAVVWGLESALWLSSGVCGLSSGCRLAVVPISSGSRPALGSRRLSGRVAGEQREREASRGRGLVDDGACPPVDHAGQHQLGHPGGGLDVELRRWEGGGVKPSFRGSEKGGACACVVL